MDSAWRRLVVEGATDAESAALQIKKDILKGALAPNEKLRVKHLTERYGIGASPMREALARLSGTGLVRLEGQKGFRVSPIASDDLVEITRARQIVESEALALAIEDGDDNWEADIVKAFHLFCRELDRRDERSEGWFEAFEARHHAFHSALIAACPSSILKSFCDDLYLRKERYRRIMFGYAFQKTEVRAEHEKLMSHVLSRDVTKARAALVDHIGITVDVIAKLLPKRSGE